MHKLKSLLSIPGNLYGMIITDRVPDRLVGVVKCFCVDRKKCVRMGREESDMFSVRVGLQERFVMFLLLFDLLMDGMTEEVNASVMGRGAALRTRVAEGP